MVLTLAQNTTFMTNAEHGMAIPAANRPAVVAEGITSVDDLVDFDKDSITLVGTNLRRLTPPVALGVKTQMRLSAASYYVRYLYITGRVTAPANIRWPVIKSFWEQWKAIKEKKDGADPEVPKITKTLTVMKWIEPFEDCLRRTIGARMVPLYYVVRPDEEVPETIPRFIATGNTITHAHSEEYGSVEQEMTFLASHTDSLFREDSQRVYFKLEEATRGTGYAATIAPFKRNFDGRGALLALKLQHAGKDKWEAKIKECEEVMFNKRWKGDSNYTLAQFIGAHRSAFVMMTQASAHVEHQLPESYTRVGYVLDHIDCMDPGLQAGIANINTNRDTEGPRYNFEGMATQLSRYCPVAKKRTSASKRGRNEISGAEATDPPKPASISGLRGGVGKTGVHLRFHEWDEYKNLSKAQKMELKEWRDRNPDQKKPSKNIDRPTKRVKVNEREVSSVVQKEVAKVLKNQEKAKKDAETNHWIMSVVEAGLKSTGMKSPTGIAKVSSSALNGIVSRIKNMKDPPNVD